MGILDSVGLSDGGQPHVSEAAHRAALSDVIDALETALVTMDELGLANAALHVSLGLELAKADGARLCP